MKNKYKKTVKKKAQKKNKKIENVIKEETIKEIKEEVKETAQKKENHDVNEVKKTSKKEPIKEMSLDEEYLKNDEALKDFDEEDYKAYRRRRKFIEKEIKKARKPSEQEKRINIKTIFKKVLATIAIVAMLTAACGTVIYYLIHMI